MKHKKFLAMLMALAMMFSLCAGAFAADDPADGNTNFSGNAEVKVPALKVSVPTSATVFINPMGFKVTLDGQLASAEDASDATKVTESKIVSPIIPIINNTPMELSVGVIGSVTPKEGNVALAISPTPITADDTKNTVFVYALFDEPTYTPAVEANPSATPPVAAQAEKYSWPESVTTTYNSTTPADNTLALTTKAPTTPVVVGSIDAATYTAATESTPAKTTPGRFAFQFLGDCNSNAKSAWNPSDAVTVALAFTFKPAPAAAADGG
jgi:hypothetical protein